MYLVIGNNKLFFRVVKINSMLLDCYLDNHERKILSSIWYVNGEVPDIEAIKYKDGCIITSYKDIKCSDYALPGKYAIVREIKLKEKSTIMNKYKQMEGMRVGFESGVVEKDCIVTKGKKQRIIFYFEEEKPEIKKTFVENDWKKYLSGLSLPKVKNRRVARIILHSAYLFRTCFLENGAIIAAPTYDPPYTYVWPRDASYVLMSLMDIRHYDYIGLFVNWLEKVQEKQGNWLQNYHVNGEKFLSSNQIDQTATVLSMLKKYHTETKNTQKLGEYWEKIGKKAADYLLTCCGNEVVTKCYDLWEENVGSFLYTQAAVYSGLNSAYLITEVLKNQKEEYLEKSRTLKKGIDNFWNGKFFIKSLNPYDVTLDSSCLALIYPFKIIDANDPKMVKTVEEIEKTFSYPIGGIGRYKNDTYCKGNPWTLTTLWLSMYYIKRGDLKKAQKYFNWCVDFSKYGLLPEQVNKDFGNPVSAHPLAWSHSFFLKVVLELQKAGVSL